MLSDWVPHACLIHSPAQQSPIKSGRIASQCSAGGVINVILFTPPAVIGFSRYKLPLTPSSPAAPVYTEKPG